MIQSAQIVQPDTDFAKYSAIIDVRSPKEFNEDHIPGAINLPVLDDEERLSIGTIYKENSFQARRQGAVMVSRNIAQHIEGHLANKGADFTPLVYCWRGGLRSNSMATVLKSIGWHVHLLHGGYQGFRRHIITDLEYLMLNQNFKIKVLAGVTGVGKTKLLSALREEGCQVIDIEGLANHRGSILGRPHGGKQPTQKMFESKLWYELKTLDPEKPVYIEAESNRIGSVHLPSAFWSFLKNSEVINITMPIEERISLTKEDYHYFIEDPEKLIQLLDVLRRIRGNAQVDLWCQQIHDEDWNAFLHSILVNHYDLAYREAGDKKSKYPAATNEFLIQKNNPDCYQETALNIINLAPPAK